MVVICFSFLISYRTMLLNYKNKWAKARFLLLKSPRAKARGYNKIVIILTVIK